MARSRRDYEEKQLEDLIAAYQSEGIVVYGQAEGFPGTYAKISVKSDGTVKVEGVVAISGAVDITDDWTRLLGQVDIARYLGSAMGVANPLHSQIVYGGAVVDPRSIRALNSNTDSAQVFGNVGLLRQAESGAAHVQGMHEGVEIDFRAIRALTSADVVTVYGSRAQALLQRATTYELLTQLSHQGTEYDARQIRTITETLTVQATDLDIRNLVKTQDEVYSVLRTDVGVVYDARDRSWTLGASDVPDLSDRAARLLGIIYGDVGQLLQRGITRDLYVALRYMGSEIDPREVNLSDADIRQTRWGIPREPTWINGSNQTAPGTTTNLVAKTVTAGKTGRIFGWQIISPEANEFTLNVGATAYRIGALAGAGVICVSLSNPMFDSIAAGTVINIRVVTAGGAGKVYRADLMYDEA